MKLSFVIPAYNEENYIGDCLTSITKEIEGKNFDVEVIVVNNACMDQTAEIASSFPGVVVIDEPTKGLVRARQAGFAASTGDLIANIDADTRLTPGWIDTIFREFGKNPALVALSGPHIHYDLPEYRKMLVKVFYALGYATYVINHFILKKSGMLQGGNFVVRRSALEKIGGYDTSIDFYGEDTDIARRMQKAGKVKFTFSFPIYASGRRFEKEGIFMSGIRYSINYFWMLFFRKAFSKKYTDIRKAR